MASCALQSVMEEKVKKNVISHKIQIQVNKITCTSMKQNKNKNNNHPKISKIKYWT